MRLQKSLSDGVGTPLLLEHIGELSLVCTGPAADG